MSNTVLTDYQSACRAAHAQVQMLQDLYGHLAQKEDARIGAAFDVGSRIRELRDLETILAAKLQEQDLLPTRPDPEKEGLIELIAEVKSTLGGDERPAISERLAAEESELVRLAGDILEQDDDDTRLSEGVARTRQRIEELSGESSGAP